MGSPSERTVDLRDLMNAIVESIEGDDQEAYIMRCCVAVGVQELEKWMYDETYTPSVQACSEQATFVRGRETASKPMIDFELPFSDWTEGEKNAFREGKKITFIKELRTRTGCGLKEGSSYWEHQCSFYPHLWNSFSKKTP